MSRNSEKGRNLEVLLQDWAVRHALPSARAETIRQAILQTPEAPAMDLTVAWWQRLFSPLATPLQRSTDMRHYLRVPMLNRNPTVWRRISESSPRGPKAQNNRPHDALFGSK